MATRKIQATKNYRMFKRSGENRTPRLEGPKRFEQSMKKYGFLPCFPIVRQRVGKDLIVKEGQHRLAFAERWGSPCIGWKTIPILTSLKSIALPRDGTEGLRPEVRGKRKRSVPRAARFFRGARGHNWIGGSHAFWRHRLFQNRETHFLRCFQNQRSRGPMQWPPFMFLCVAI